MAARTLTVLLLALPAALPLEAAERPTLRRSDVVFMYDNPKLYQAYGCTAMGWAGSSDAKRVEDAHAKGVRLFSTSVGFRTEAAQMIDFTPDFLKAACRNFAGETFIVPWLWDHKHKGQPSWWFCTNSPLYRKYLDHRILQVMKAPVDGLHIDDYSGTAGAVTWRSACFCEDCMARFRKYLEGNVPKEKVAALGIHDLAKFDYRQFLLDQGVKPEEYQRRRAQLPLAGEFLDYQVKANTAFVAEYRLRAERYRGRPLALCVNSGLTDPISLAIAPHLSYFCCEVNHQAPSHQVPTHPIYVYKLADGVGRPVASTASGQDWAYVYQHKVVGLVRTWTALSYAFGHNLMAPHRQWCYTEQKGTHWYEGPTEAFAPLYRFVRDRARLLDDYDAAASVAVVYDNAARRKGQGNIEPICTALAEKNVPFTVVVAGDDWLDFRLDAASLARFRRVVVAKDFEASPLDTEQKTLLERAAVEGRLVVWNDPAPWDKLAPSEVVVKGSDRLFVVPRVARGRDKPAVIHLVNRQYDRARDGTVPQEDLTIRIARSLLANRSFTQAVIHVPGAEPQKLDLALDNESLSIQVPRLDFWGIVELN